MTETGTFVINGAERVIVSQLVRPLEFITQLHMINLVRDCFPVLLFRTEVHGWNMKQIPMMYSMYVWTEPVRFRSLC